MRQDLKLLRLGGSPLVSLLVLSCTLFFSPWALLAQQPTPRKAPIPKAPAKAATPLAPAAEQPQFKGIWEPVNYPEDLQLTDVFFVSADVGWVSGAKGTILHTKDGGATWTAQLGGDPESGGNAIEGLRFLDETHGWAFQVGWAGRLGSMLLRTTDGENWEEVGPFGEMVAWKDYQFTSETEGVLFPMGPQQAAGKHIWRTQDAGRHWQEVFTCQTKTVVGGLTREVDCLLMGLHFPSPTIGYAIGANRGITDRIFVAKTEDSGASWNLRLVPGPEVGTVHGPGDLYAFFVDENTGFIRLSNGKIYATTDGGESWTGLIAAPAAGPSIKFADPEVGWSFIVGGGNNARMLIYTLDGGKRWTSTRIAFPADVNAFNLPRRDSAYVVGDHGMIYRYRVVPITEEVANALPAPLMPGFDSPLDEQVEQLSEEAETLESSLTEAVQAEGVEPGAAPAETPEEEPEAGGEEEAEEAEEPTAPVTGWAKDCCGSKIQKLQTVLEAVSTEIPQFTGKYRNLNLVSTGVQLIGQFFGQAQSLKDSFRALRKARNPQAALSALTELTNQVQQLRQTTKSAFQKQE